MPQRFGMEVARCGEWAWAFTWFIPHSTLMLPIAIGSADGPGYVQTSVGFTSALSLRSAS